MTTIHEINHQSPVRAQLEAAIVFQLKQVAERQVTSAHDAILVSEGYGNPLDKTKQEQSLTKTILPTAAADTQKGARIVVPAQALGTTQAQQAMSLIALMSIFFRLVAESQSSSFNAMYGIGNAQLNSLISMTPDMQKAILSQFNEQAATCINDATKATIQGWCGIGGFAVGVGGGLVMHGIEGNESEENISGQKVETEQDLQQESESTKSELTSKQDELRQAPGESREEIERDVTKLKEKLNKLEAQKTRYTESAQSSAAMKRKEEAIAQMKKEGQNPQKEEAELNDLKTAHAKLQKEIQKNKMVGETKATGMLGKLKSGFEKIKSSTFTKVMKKITDTNQLFAPLAQGIGQTAGATQDREKADHLKSQGAFTATSEGLKMISQALQQCIQRSEAGTGQFSQTFESIIQGWLQNVQALVSALTRN